MNAQLKKIIRNVGRMLVNIGTKPDDVEPLIRKQFVKSKLDKGMAKLFVDEYKRERRRLKMT